MEYDFFDLIAGDKEGGGGNDFRARKWKIQKQCLNTETGYECGIKTNRKHLGKEIFFEHFEQIFDLYIVLHSTNVSKIQLKSNIVIKLW